MKISLRKGFTLIELLVVITIIGILATGAVTVFTSQIQKARDTTRINDIKALQSAVEQTYQDLAAYPDAVAWTWFVDDVDAYIAIIPKDPKEGQNCQSSGTIQTTCFYSYQVGDDGGITNWVYELSTGFEAEGNINVRAADTVDNGNDPARFENGIQTDILSSAVPAGVAETDWCTLAASSSALLLGSACN